MNFTQDVLIYIVNNTALGTIGLKNAQATVGKFYRDIINNDAMESEEVNQMTLAPEAKEELRACNSDDAEGCEGQVDLYDGTTKICAVSWNNSDVEIRECNEADGYRVSCEGYNVGSTSLVRNVEVTKEGDFD